MATAHERGDKVAEREALVEIGKEFFMRTGILTIDG